MGRDRRSRWSVRKLLPAFAVLATLIVATSGLTERAGDLYAESAGATDATLTWKVSQYAWSFSSLSQAHETTEPAFKDADNGFVFPQGSGTYDPDTGETSIDFTGSLRLGNTSQGGYRIFIANPSIVIDAAGAGSLTADISYCTGTANCNDPGPTTPERVLVVNFQTTPEGVTDTGSEVSWTFTPDYVLQGNPDFPERRQFPQSLIDALAASLQNHFRDSGSGNDPIKPPAPITLSFAYGAETGGTTQTILTTVGDGALSISVSGEQVSLPSPVLNSEGTALVSSGEINTVIVTDLRAANPGWSVSGQVSDFTANGQTFGGEHLGWTPEVVSTSTSQVVTPGAEVAPSGVAGGGLLASSGLGSADAGEGLGTAELGAELDLQISASTPPGEYSATLTLTVI